MRLATIISHPIQYYTPIFSALAKECDLHVFYAQQVSPRQQSTAGFGVDFDWDIDLLAGHHYEFLQNKSARPSLHHFWGSDTPEIEEKLLKGRFDAVMVVGWYLKSFMQAIWAAKRLRIPVMVRGDSHLSMPRSRIKTLAKELAFPRFLRLFDSALYVGHHSRSYYRHYGYPEERLFFSPHCIDNDWFRSRATPEARQNLRGRLGIGPDVTVLLFAGKLVPFKRPQDVIDAAAKCRAEGGRVEVMIAGSGELEAELREQAATLSVPLHLLGFRNQSEMPAAYAAADILVLPSTGRETWGLVANEAIACGRPVIVSNACGCAPDLAADARVGRIAAVGDSDGLAAAAMELTIRSPSSLDFSAKAARYSIEAAVHGILQACEFATRAMGRHHV